MHISFPERELCWFRLIQYTKYKYVLQLLYSSKARVKGRICSLGYRGGKKAVLYKVFSEIFQIRKTERIFASVSLFPRAPRRMASLSLQGVAVASLIPSFKGRTCNTSKQSSLARVRGFSRPVRVHSRRTSTIMAVSRVDKSEADWKKEVSMIVDAVV